MKITVNNRAEEYPDLSLTVRQLLARKGWNFPLLVVQVDGVLVERADYTSFAIRDGANVALVHLVSGG